MKKEEETLKDNQKENLEKLEEQKIRIEQKLEIAKSYRTEEKIVKTLTIFGHSCNFLAPFILMAGLSIGGMKLIGKGYPFILDDVIKKKQYTLEIESDGIINIEEEYIFKTNTQENYRLTEYTPWKKEEDIYKRKIKTYDIVSEHFPMLYNAVVSGNLEMYLNENEDNFKEEQETVNESPILYEKSLIEGTLVYVDAKDTIIVPERISDNLLITLVELCFSIAGGSILAYKRDYKFIKSLKSTMDEYKKYIKSIERLEQEAKDIQQQIMILKKTGSDNCNDK